MYILLLPAYLPRCATSSSTSPPRVLRVGALHASTGKDNIYNVHSAIPKVASESDFAVVG